MYIYEMEVELFLGPLNSDYHNSLLIIITQHHRPTVVYNIKDHVTLTKGGPAR